MSQSNSSPHGRLNGYAYEIIKGLVDSKERVDATIVGRLLWKKVSIEKDFESQEILAIEGAHQFAMKAIQQFGPQDANEGVVKSARRRKEKKPLFDWAGLSLPQDEIDILQQLPFYQVRTKTWGYVFVATATFEQLDEAIALRATQIGTMALENDLMQKLADLRR